MKNNQINSKYFVFVSVIYIIAFIITFSMVAGASSEYSVAAMPASTSEQFNCNGLTSQECLNENPILEWLRWGIALFGSVIGVGAVIMVIVAGLQYSAARDNPQSIQAARTRLTNVLIGLFSFVFLFSFLQWLVPGGVFGSRPPKAIRTASYAVGSEEAISQSSTYTSSINQQSPSTPSYSYASSSWPSSQEFDTIDTKIWRLYDRSNGAEKFGHTDPQALHLYSDNQIKADNGSMVITAKKRSDGNWDSGFASSKETKHFMPLYGKIEVRAQLPHAPGIWPAIWLRHRSGSSVAEVDTAEVFYAGGDSVSQSLHFPKTAGTHVIGKGVDLSNQNGWHTYWSDIRPAKNGAIKFTLGVDGKTTDSYTLSASNAKYVKAVSENATWAVALNIAVTDDKWSGDANKASSPQVMKVDWVRWSK